MTKNNPIKRQLAEQYAERIYAHSLDKATAVRTFMRLSKSEMVRQAAALVAKGQ